MIQIKFNKGSEKINFLRVKEDFMDSKSDGPIISPGCRPNNGKDLLLPFLY